MRDITIGIKEIQMIIRDYSDVNKHIGAPCYNVATLFKREMWRRFNQSVMTKLKKSDPYFQSPKTIWRNMGMLSWVGRTLTYLCTSGEDYGKEG